MAKRNTRDEIQLEALRLFSERGYEGVGIRDIAKCVNIRESAIYRHFKNKQDIFNSLILRMNDYYDQVLDLIQLPGCDVMEAAIDYENSDGEMIANRMKAIFLFWLQDEFAAPFRRMLTIEQFKNTEVGDTFQKMFFNSVFVYMEELFNRMMKDGYIIQSDAKLMSVQFYSPIFLMLNQYDKQQDKVEEAIAIIEKHVEWFCKIYFVNKENCSNE